MHDKILMMAKRNSVLVPVLIFLGVILLMAFTIWGAIWVSNIDNRKAAAKFPPCKGESATHKVIIEDNKVKPSHTDAHRCDKLIITNLDNRPRTMAFGLPDKHIAYDGITERYLSPQGKFEVDLIEPGTFIFHDHQDHDVEGTFTVTETASQPARQ